MDVASPAFDLQAEVMDMFHASVKQNLHRILDGIFTPKARRFLESRVRITQHPTDDGVAILVRFMYDSYLEIESQMTSKGVIDFKYRKLSVKDYLKALEDQGMTDLEAVHTRVEGLTHIGEMFDLPIKIATPQVALGFVKKGLPFVVGVINKALQLG